MNKIRSITSVVCISFLGLSACTSASPFVPDATSENTTAEGLVRVENSRFDAVYVRPGFDLTKYDSVILAPVSIAYKSSQPDNELNDRQLDLMKRYFSEALEAVFSEEGQYQLVSSAGPGTMRVHAGIADLEINVPTETTGIARNRVFVASSGQMTLVADIYDAESNEVLVRVVDRRQAQEYWRRATMVSEWAEVRSAFRYWTRIARDRIDAVHANQF